MKVPLYKIAIGKEERMAVDRVLASGNLAQGKVVEEFEKKFAKFIRVKYACAVANGTVALHLALLALGIKAGDEVITTPFSFIATANAILYTGARPVFVDINEETFNINPELIESKVTKHTKAILLVHLFGNPCEMDKIMAIAKKHKLAVIEDSCQAHGAEWEHKKVGSFGTGVFSFYPTKNMTTGEGGIITTNSKEIFEKCSLLRNHGSKIKYYHDILGYNYRMTNLAAALGIEQLKKLNKFNILRLKNAVYLNKNLGQIKGVIVPKATKKAKHVYHQYTLRLSQLSGLSRREVLDKLDATGIGTAIFYPRPINHQKVYKELGYKINTPVAEKVSREVLSLPVHPGLKLSDLNYIVKIFKQIISV